MSKICFSTQGSPSLFLIFVFLFFQTANQGKKKNCHQETSKLMRNFYWSNLKEDLQKGKYNWTFEIIAAQTLGMSYL